MGAVFLSLSGLPDCVWLFKSIHLILRKPEIHCYAGHTYRALIAVQGMTARLRTKLLKSRTGQAIEKVMHMKSWATICGSKPIVSLNPFRTVHNNAQEHGDMADSVIQALPW
jgi:hypothetical protein